ncbi:MAG TPA: fused MFS/spermidine synthase, partial [Bacteroidia bacterium]|nr:fused MFS/spermidine synthase [Bacteroidia bacterium]
MAAEVCGAKLLAPVFGSSLYVWASVMAVTLLALSSGYFYGARVSSRTTDHKNELFRVLIVASVLILLMPFISSFVLPYFRLFSFTSVVLLSTILLLFLPVFLLGTSSPLFIAIQSNELDTAGKVSGTVYAVSTLGGILSTLSCGFFFIPELGLKVTLIGFGLLLFTAVFLCLKKMKFTAMLLATFALLTSFVSFENKSNVLYSSDGMMGLVTVEKSDRVGKELLYLKVNGIVQSEMDLATGRSASAYIQLLDSMIHPSITGSKALILGVGG